MMTIAEMFVEDAARRKSPRHPLRSSDGRRGAPGERIEADTPVEGMPRAFVPRGYDGRSAVCPCACRCRGVEPSALPPRFRLLVRYLCHCQEQDDRCGGAPAAQRASAPGGRRDGSRPPCRTSHTSYHAQKARQWGGSTLIQMYMAWIPELPPPQLALADMRPR